MRLKSLLPKRVFCLPIRLPWMSQSTDTPSFPELLVSVSPWSGSISALESHYLHAHNNIVYNFLVTEISLWKHPNAPNHEFVIARLTEGGALRMERSVEDSEGGSSAASSRSSLTSSSSPVPAHDFITLYALADIGLATAECEEITTCVFPAAQRPTIAAVIAACSVISQKEPKYKLRTKQCYWFAGLVYRLIAGQNYVPQPRGEGGMQAAEFAHLLQILREPELTRQASAIRPEYKEKLARLQQAVEQKLRKDREAENAQREAAEAKRETEMKAKEVEKAKRETEMKAKEVEKAKRETEMKAKEVEEAKRETQEALRQAREAEEKAQSAKEAYELELSELRQALEASKLNPA